MKIAILGTGVVGKTLGTHLVGAGYPVRMGSRTADNDGAGEWASGLGDRATNGTFADAAAFGDVVLNCVGGMYALDVLASAGTENLADKVLIDVSNPLDFSKGFPPSLAVANTESLAERIQAAHPEARVVKALNTVANHLMVDPESLAGGDHTLLISGDDHEAKALVRSWLSEWFGWTDIVDVGELSAARGTEAWLLLWTRLYDAFGHANFNLKLVR